MTTTTAHPRLLGELGAQAWDRLAGEHFYSTAAWLELCAMHGGGVPGAVVQFANGEPSAAVPYAALSAPPPALYRWNDLLLERGLPALPADGLLVGPRQGYETNFLVAPGHDRVAAIAQLVLELRERSTDIARGGGGDACVAMYLPTEDVHALRAAGVSSPPVLLEADAWLELPGGGWDAWLGSLPSKRRVNVRREVRAFSEAGFTVVRMALEECHEQLPALVRCTQSKYGDAGETADWLALLRMHVAAMGSAAQVALCLRDDGTLVGFCLYYVWGDTLYLRWAGFDYDRLAGAAEYFNLLYYSQIMVAAQLGVRRLHAGIKSLEAKALRGAQLRPLWLVDLAQDSVLSRHGDEVRAHNRLVHERLAADGRTRSALRAGAWGAFS